MANRFLSNITINDAYTFPSADGTNGQVIGTDGAGNLSFVDQGTEALTLNVTVKNVSGGSLVKGTIVHAHPSANPPSGNVVEVIAADYDDATKMPAIGVLNETLANEAEGQAIMFGAVSGIDTSSFSAGDELWVGNDGAFTNTKPTTAGQLIQKIAVVIKSHASNGLIKIFGAGRTNDVPLPLYIDNTNQRVGVSISNPSYKLDVNGGASSFRTQLGSGSFYSNDYTMDLSIYSTGGWARGFRVYNTNDNTYSLGFGKTGDYAYFVVDDPDVVDTTLYNSTKGLRVYNSGNVYVGQSLGVGTISPTSGYGIDVVGSGIRSIRSTGGWAGWFENTGSSSGIVITAGVDSGDAPLLVRTQNGTEIFSVRGDGRSWFTGTNVGIGTSSPTQKLHVVGNIYSTGQISTSGGSSNDVLSQYVTIQDLTSTDDYVLRFRNSSGSQTGYIGKISTFAGFTYQNSNGHKFNNPTTIASTLTLTSALKGPSTFYIDPSPDDTGEPGGATTDTGTVVILGDLQVTGTTTTIDSTTLNVGDLNIVLAKDATTAAAANGAGITINGANATMTYDSTNDRFNFNKAIASSTHVTSGANVYSGTSGQFRNYAGVWTATTGVSGNGFGFISADGTAMTISSTGFVNISDDLSVNNTITTPTNTNLALIPNGTGNVYFGNSTNGNIIYHYSRLNDGIYTIFDHTSTLSRFNTTASAGFLFDKNVDVNGSVTADDYRSTGTFYLTSGDDWRFRSTGGTERMRITSAGDVGIGTTTPSGKLEVNGGNVKFSHQQNGVSRLELYQNRQDLGNVGIWTIAAYNASEVANISFFRGSGGSSGYTKIFSKKNNTSSLEEVVQFGANDALTSTFRGDVVVEGNISIPNASAYKIDGTDILEHNTSYTQLNNPEGATCIYVGDSADRTNYYDNNTHRFRTAGGTSIYGDWNSTGLGVGTTSPLTKFHVYGDAVDNQSLGLFTNTYSSGGVFFPALKAVHTHSNHSYGIVAEFRTEAGAGTDRSAILFTNAHSASNWAVGQGVVGAVDDFAVGYRSAHPNTAPGWATGYFRISTAGDVSISNNIKSPIFYDSNDTGYFLDPATAGNGTVLNGVKINYLGVNASANTSGNYRINMGGSIHMNANNIDYINQLHFSDNVRFYDNGDDSFLNFKFGDASVGGIKFLNVSNAQQGFLYASASGFGLLSADGTWAVQTINNATTIHHSARSPIFYDSDNTAYYVDPATRSQLTSTNISLNDATALTDGTFNVSKSIKGGIHFTNGAGTGTANGYQASITFQGSSVNESQAGIYVHNNNSAGTYMALATTNNYSNGPQIALRIDNNGKVFADRNFIQSNTDMRAPLFYDSNNTSYYVHPDNLSHLNIVRVPGDIRGDGQQLILNAGESAAYATGQTGENVYVNAENGLQVNSSPDNWGSGWAGRYTATICDAAGNSYFPGRVQAGEIYTAGKVIHTGDTDTYTEFNAADTWRVVVGGSQKLVVNSSSVSVSNATLSHQGLTPTSGTNIDQIYEVGMSSFTLTANTWTDTGINSTDLATGTYVVQVFVSDHNAGGGHYSEYYSGTMSWYAANTNSTNVDEIVLHNAGHASNASHLQLRTQRHGSGGDDLMLQVKQNFTHSTALDGTSGKQMVFKFRRLI